MYASAMVGYGLIAHAGNRTQKANSRIRKSTEKLSSMLRINRAGDDAAGLAISEKMKAECTMLATAQKNVKDGISLVQTAEGALQEIHDMLNRLTELADQSANGTYTTEDRSKLQDEVEQLKREIDRIANSANFNGQNLIDGSLDGDIPAEQSEDLEKMIAQSINYGNKVAGALENKAAARSLDSENGISALSDEGPVIASRAADGADTPAGGTEGTDAPGTTEGTDTSGVDTDHITEMKETENDVFKKIESTAGQEGKKTCAEIKGSIGNLSKLRDGHFMEIKIKDENGADKSVKFNFVTDYDTYSGKGNDNNVFIDIEGKSGGDIAEALKNAIQSNAVIKESMVVEPTIKLDCSVNTDGTIILTQTFDRVGTVTEIHKKVSGKTFEITTGAPTDSSSAITGAPDGGGTCITITKDALKDGKKFGLQFGSDKIELEIRVFDENKITNAADLDAGILYVSKNNWYKGFDNLKGTFVYALSEYLKSYESRHGVCYEAVVLPVDKGEVEISIEPAYGSSAGKLSFDSSVDQQVKPPQKFTPSSGSVPVTSKFEVPSRAKTVATIDTSKMIDGDIFTVTYDGSEKTFEVYSSDTPSSGNTGILRNDDLVENLKTALKTLSTDDYEFSVEDDGKGIVTLTVESKSIKSGLKIGIKSNINSETRPPKDKDPEKPPVNPEDPDNPNKPDDPDTPDKPPKLGKALRLQIGEGSSGAVYVSLEDMSVKGLSIEGVDIGTQDGAASAIDTIRSAINKVSVNRGTLGALTNRLEHAYNNLGVSYENLTDAENKISGTDVAQEMMRHTKNQIIGQAAQSMLAQAMNVKRQSVQQLLSF